jgi:hypothetical protein
MFASGLNTEDVRGFHYRGGKIPNELIGIICFRGPYETCGLLEWFRARGFVFLHDVTIVLSRT